MFDPSLLDSLVTWTGDFHTANPSSATLLFEAFEARGDSALMRLGVHTLLSCTSRDNADGRQFPALLESLAIGYRITGDKRFKSKARALAREWLEAGESLWTDSYSDQLGYRIAGVITVGLALDDRRLVEQGVTLTDTLLARAYTPGDGVRHRLENDAADGLLLDDQIAVAWAALGAHRATGSDRYVAIAIDLMEIAGRTFGDPLDGGYFDFVRTEPKGGTALVEPLKPVYDGFLPSGNAAAARATLELYRRTGDERWLSSATRTLETFARTSRDGHLGDYGRAVQELLAILPRDSI